jgi:hypothetical protein
MYDTTYTNAGKHNTTLEANGVRAGLTRRSRRRQLFHLRKYRMCQRAAAVDQPPFSPVLDTTDDTLNRIDVSGVQAPSARVKWKRQYSMSVGKSSINLPNNRKTNVFRLLRFEFFGFGNGDDYDVQKLPEERLDLEIFGTVLMAPVSIDELLVLLSKA